MKKNKPETRKCEFCQNVKVEPITLCVDCDEQYILIDVRHYRALKAGSFKLKKKINLLEKVLRI